MSRSASISSGARAQRLRIECTAPPAAAPLSAVPRSAAEDDGPPAGVASGPATFDSPWGRAAGASSGSLCRGDGVGAGGEGDRGGPDGRGAGGGGSGRSSRPRGGGGGSGGVGRAGAGDVGGGDVDGRVEAAVGAGRVVPPRGSLAGGALALSPPPPLPLRSRSKAVRRSIQAVAPGARNSYPDPNSLLNSRSRNSSADSVVSTRVARWRIVHMA